MTKLYNDGFADKYYDSAWSRIGKSISAQEEARIKETLKSIPDDCNSILDVGCGDGRITNRLIYKYKRVVGLDTSEEALKQVESEKALGTLDHLQFPDRSFDLVLCCEVLEHLPFPIYSKALVELERVSKKYIIVTVPNQQDQRLSAVTCPYCGCKFDQFRHIRVFDIENMKRLFTDFSPITIIPMVMTKNYSKYVYRVRHFINQLVKPQYPIGAVCPQCSYFEQPNGAQNPNGSIVKGLRYFRTLQKVVGFLPKQQKGIWIKGLYERKQTYGSG